MLNEIDKYPFANVGNNVFYSKEFHIGNMLPIGGSTKSYLSKPIGEVLDDTEKEINQKENLKDTIKKATYDYHNAYPIDEKEDWSGLMEAVKFKNDKGEKVPKICPKCGGDVGVFIKGEPVFLCKKCQAYYGTLPFKSESTSMKEATNWRSQLEDSEFGIPEERKYPLHDKRHVILAIRMFYAVDKKNEEKLANKILSKMKEYDIPTSVIKDKNKLKKYVTESTVEQRSKETMIDTNCIVESMYEEFFGEAYNGGDPKVPDEIEPVVSALEAKGYSVKYASPGHLNTRFDNDRNKDGVINAKMVSTGRIIFSRNYDFPNTPAGWEWKVLSNNAKALYAKPYTYNEKMGTQQKAIAKWRKLYLESVKKWAAALPHVGTKDTAKTEPDTNFAK